VNEENDGQKKWAYGKTTIVVWKKAYLRAPSNKPWVNHGGGGGGGEGVGFLPWEEGATIKKPDINWSAPYYGVRHGGKKVEETKLWAEEPKRPPILGRAINRQLGQEVPTRERA